MKRFLWIAVVATLAGCDLGGAPHPEWTRSGAVASFDYLAGPDSLYDYVSGTVLPDTRSAVEMRVQSDDDGRPGDRSVRWGSPTALVGVSPFVAGVSFPLDDQTVDVSEAGLRVVTPINCRGNGWVGGSYDLARWVRVPRVLGPVNGYGSCSRSQAPDRLYDARRMETVVTPAGAFEALVLESLSGRSVEYWTWDDGLVRFDTFNDEGVLRGRFVRSE